MRPVRKADNLPPSCAVVMKSRNLNFLEPSGPVQVCNETALPFCYKRAARYWSPRLRFWKLSIEGYMCLTSQQEIIRMNNMWKLHVPLYRPGQDLKVPGGLSQNFQTISVSRLQTHRAATRTKSMKDPNDSNGKRTRDFSACSASLNNL